jgi:hypothetical protein
MPVLCGVDEKTRTELQDEKIFKSLFKATAALLGIEREADVENEFCARTHLGEG